MALKTASGVAHKIDVDGVRLGLVGPAAVGAAYDDVADRLGPHVQVQQQVEPGVEVSVGIVRDPLFGWLVVLGAGGTLVELLDESAVGLAPVDPSTAAALLADTRAATLLTGWRGRPAVEQTVGHAAAAAISALSVVAHELGDLLEVLEVNPLIITPGGVVGVDALLR